MKRHIITLAAMAAALLWQVITGLQPMTEPYVVFFSGVLAAFLAWVALRLLFALVDKLR